MKIQNYDRRQIERTAPPDTGKQRDVERSDRLRSENQLGKLRECGIRTGIRL